MRQGGGGPAMYLLRRGDVFAPWFRCASGHGLSTPKGSADTSPRRHFRTRETLGSKCAAEFRVRSPEEWTVRSWLLLQPLGKPFAQRNCTTVSLGLQPSRSLFESYSFGQPGKGMVDTVRDQINSRNGLYSHHHPARPLIPL